MYALSPRPMVQAASSMNPTDWPIGVKQYVERCFRFCKPSQREVLQAALRLIIHDAQSKGELYSRSWETLPVPDLALNPQDAASIVIKFSNYSVQRPTTSGAIRPMTVAQPTMVSIDTNMKKRPFIDTKDTGRPRKFSNVSQGGAYADDESIRRQQRAGRFKEDQLLLKKKKAHPIRPRVNHVPTKTGDVPIDWDAFALRGTCKDIEKSYFRLTSAPDPSTVRPEPILRKALRRLVGLIASGDVTYFYAQDQFKGMRQDCVVQALKGAIAVDIYEAHARAALEYGDMAEYNQCQGQLRYLYSLKDNEHNAEFVAYRILYQSIFSYTNENKSELVGLLESLSILDSQLEKTRHVRHALAVRKSLVSHNYAFFFKLYATAPALGRALMDVAVPKIRFSCITAFAKAFKPALDVEFVCKTLGFISVKEQCPTSYLPGCCSVTPFEGKYKGVEQESEALKKCITWLKECGVVLLSNDMEKIDCTLTLPNLKMPEEKDVVAHGDANLDIADFFIF